MASGGSVLISHPVGRVEIGTRTSLTGQVLTVGQDQAAELLADPALAWVRVSTANPGDSTRLVKVLDAVEPRCGEAESSRADAPLGHGVFPGFLAPPDCPAPAVIHRLAGAAVVVAGHLPRAQEAVVDMCGPAAPLSPLGSTANVVVEFSPAAGATWEAVDIALRRGALGLAAHLAEAAIDQPGDSDRLTPEPDAAPQRSDLPAVGAVTNLQTQGVFKDVFVRGVSFAGCPPQLLDAAEVAAGAVVSGQFGHPSLKNPTWIHQNHPVVTALLARHGHDLRFAGLVISPEPVDATGKEAVSVAAADLCARAGFQAVVVTKEGGGNADGDMALKMDALEDRGISAVGIFAEMSGPDGTGPPVVVPPERAVAMISSGNYDHRLALPAMDRVLGGAELALLRRPATEAMELPLAVIYASLSPMGWGHLTAGPGAAGTIGSSGAQP
ncbi:MAG: glycine/sarcosine/betaine reductase component B subunit [Acidimicrobiales bacterium]